MGHASHLIPVIMALLGMYQHIVTPLTPFRLAHTRATVHFFKPIQELNSALLHTLKHGSIAANYGFMQVNLQLFTGLATKGF